jgi:haloalkane dehalogenase
MMHALPSWVDREQFPFEPQWLDLPSSNERLSVTDVGAGPVVVFSHGTPTWSYEYRHLIRRLMRRYRCVAPDHLGFGLSPRPPEGDYRPEAHARRFSELVEQLGLHRYHLIIHDFGGPFALDEALTRPERVASLTVFNTFAWAFGDTPQRRRMAKMAGTGLFRFLYARFNFSFVIARSSWGTAQPANDATWQPYTAVFPDAASRVRVLWALARGLEGSSRFCESLWSRIARLSQVPTQFIWGMKDSAFPPSFLARWRAEFPKARVLELEKSGHWPHEEEAQTCGGAVERFLDEVEAS